MRYVSTRNNNKDYSFQEVFLKGLADDGGLFIPKSLFKFSDKELNSLKELNYQDLAKVIIQPFVKDFINQSDLSQIINKSYSAFRKKNVIDLIQIGDRKIYILVF